MRPTGFELESQQRSDRGASDRFERLFESLDHPIVRHGAPAILADGELRARVRVSADRRVDRATSIRRNAPDDRVIGALDAPLRHRARQRGHGAVRLGDDQET